MSLQQALPLIGAAVAVAALAVVTEGISIGPTLFVVAAAGAAAGALLSTVLFTSKTQSTSTPQLTMATATEGFPIPITFGTVRIPGNYWRWEPQYSSQIATYGPKQGKGGNPFSSSKGSVTGYIYATCFEYGLCMGPIDAVGEIYTSPGNYKIRELLTETAGTGTLVVAAGSNLITGIGTSFTTQLAPYTQIWAGDPTLDTTPVYTVLSVQDDTHATLYEDGNNAYDGGFTYQTFVNAATPFTGDYQDIGLPNATGTGNQDESGTIRVYQGNATQTRDSSNTGFDPWSTGDTVMNYRNRCFVLFGNGYQLGRQPQANTYMFEVVRFPKCLSADGVTPIANFVTRGSYDSGHVCYGDANPAAVAFECLTNPIWGLGRPLDNIDIDSFVFASQELALANVGMSFTVDQQLKFSDICDELKNHCNLIIYFDGTLAKCKWLYGQYGTSYQINTTLTKSSLKSFQFNVAAWGTQFNEIRAEIVNRLNYYATELVHFQDLASIQAMGYINSRKVTFRGFSNQDVGQRMTQRVLRDSSYPSPAIQFETGRWDSYMEQCDLIQIIWDEWYPTPVRTYWRVLSVEYMEDSEGGVKVTATQDTGYVPTTDANPTYSLPIFPYLNQPILSDASINQSSGSVVAPPKFTPIGGLEANCYVSQLSPSALFFCQKYVTYLTGIDVQWSDAGASTFKDLGVISPFAVTGLLAATYPVTPTFDRKVGLSMNLSLLTDLGTIIEANQVPNSATDFTGLLNTYDCFLIIDQEIMQVGLAVSAGGNTVTIANIVRGLFGTAIQNHAAGASCFYIPTYTPSAYALALTGMSSEASTGTAVEFQAFPQSSRNPATDGTDVSINPDNTVKYLAYRPFAPLLKGAKAATVASGTPGTTAFDVDFVLRPRCIAQGVGVDTLGVSQTRTGSPVDPLTSFSIMQLDSTGANLLSTPDILDPYTTIINTDPTDPTSGVIEVTNYPCHSNCKSLAIYVSVNGWQCIAPLIIPAYPSPSY